MLLPLSKLVHACLFASVGMYMRKEKSDGFVNWLCAITFKLTYLLEKS